MSRDRSPEPITEEPPKKKKSVSNKPDTSWSAWLKAGIDRSVPEELFRAGAPALKREASPAPVRVEPLASAAPVYIKARLGVTVWADGEGKGHQPPPRSGPSLPGASRLSAAEKRELGTRMHQLLEFGDWKGLQEEADSSGVDLSLFWEWMRTPEAGRVFRDADRVLPEFAFDWRNGTSTISGRIDRLIITGSEAWVIDYKIMLSSTRSEDLLERYGPQLRAYAEAVKTLTKFPVVRAFILDLAASTGTIWHEVGPS